MWTNIKGRTVNEEEAVLCMLGDNMNNDEKEAWLGAFFPHKLPKSKPQETDKQKQKKAIVKAKLNKMTDTEIAQLFRHLIMKHHPDRNQTTGTGNNNLTAELIKAQTAWRNGQRFWDKW